VEVDPTRMCEKLVGLGDVDLVGVDDRGEGGPLVVVIRSRRPRPMCEACGGSVWSKGYRSVVLVDLPAFGRPVRDRREVGSGCRSLPSARPVSAADPTPDGT
jgi:hypothetical protein